MIDFPTEPTMLEDRLLLAIRIQALWNGPNSPCGRNFEDQ
jgi:hypothetical protein